MAQIGLANAFGKDKLNFNDRLDWAWPSVQPCLRKWIPLEAEEPAYAFAMMSGL